MKIQPLSDFVFLRYKKQEKKSGVILSDVSKNKPAEAEVVVVGPGRLNRDNNLVKTILKKGDIIIIDSFLVREIEINNEKYFILRESEVFGKYGN